MAIVNTIKQFVDSRGLSAYRFRKETGIAQATAYSLYKKPSQIPRSDVLDAICTAYGVQPGEILQWVSKAEVRFPPDH